DNEIDAQLVDQSGDRRYRFADFQVRLHIQAGLPQKVEAVLQFVLHLLFLGGDFLVNADHGNHRIFADDDRLRRIDDNQQMDVGGGTGRQLDAFFQSGAAFRRTVVSNQNLAIHNASSVCMDVNPV